MVDFLKDTLTVTPADDGRVAVTVLLPLDLARDYCRFLDSFASFFQTINRKSIVASIAARAVQSDPEKDAVVATYSSRVVTAFDQYIASGLDRKSAIRLIAADLREVNHPWRSPDLVRSTPVSAGRGGHPGRPCRGKQ